MHRFTGKEHHATQASPAVRHYRARAPNPVRNAQDSASALVHADAANDAFAALFDGVDDFDAMAREATQAPYAAEPPDSSAVAIDARRAVRR